MACINTSYSSLLVSLVHASVDPVSYIPRSGTTGHTVSSLLDSEEISTLALFLIVDHEQL